MNISREWIQSQISIGYNVVQVNFGRFAVVHGNPAIICKNTHAVTVTDAWKMLKKELIVPTNEL